MTLLTLYSRPGCHLCELMLEAVLPRIRGRAEIRVVDIDEDPDLRVRYGHLVPVLSDGEHALCHYQLDVAALERHLSSVAP
ncbi:MAG: glutaredoxin family protein [Gammaproteobacteria bacterium]|nr:glutaredoxin family protein [Gammaproteobacteria bacterium]